MRKFILTVFLCGLAYGCYYYFKHKNRFIYKIPDGQVSVPESGRNFDSLLTEYNKLEKGLNVLIESSKSMDQEIIQLKQQISELSEENRRLRGTQDQKAVTISTTKKAQQNDIPKKKDLPIARNADTRMLDEFFQNRYGSK